MPGGAARFKAVLSFGLSNTGRAFVRTHEKFADALSFAARFVGLMTELPRVQGIFPGTLGQAVIFVGPSESSVHFFGARSATLILFATYAIATESRLTVSSTLSGVMPA